MKGFKHFFTVPPIQTKRLVISGIGVQEQMPPMMINRTKGTGDYLFMYFYEPVWVASSDLPGHCPAGTMMIWTPGRWQLYGDRINPFRHSWIHCDGGIIRELLAETKLPVDEPMRVNDASIVERHLLQVYEEVTRQSTPDIMIVRNLLDNMMRQIARAIRPADPQRVIPEAYIAVRHLIESEYERKLPLKELAAIPRVSISHFCEMFRHYYHSAPREYLIRHRLHQAAFMLRDRNLSVKEAAHRVGYTSVYAFSQLFKKHFRTTPSSFRTQEPEQQPK